ncbi:hypothetical protein BYT27DRAFT_7197281 [Phlegmacium glaucopus]|nr:hypothetical protein BYT27DRAFT_7197281 [Phlegmacium glaucopus]
MSFEPPSKSSSTELGSTVRIDIITTEETIPLRHSVLWPNMPPSHVYLPEDTTGIHYGAFLPLRETPVAVISLFLEDPPSLGPGHCDPVMDLKPPTLKLTNEDEDGGRLPTQQQRAMRFRKFACEHEFQGKGIGTQLLVYVLSIARTELDAATVWCDARATARGWYMKRGLVPFGPTFYKGPEEYIRMRIDFSRDVSKGE